MTAIRGGSLSGNKRHEDSPDDRQDDIRPGNDRHEDSHDERQDGKVSGKGRPGGWPDKESHDYFGNCSGNGDGCCIAVSFSLGGLPPRTTTPPPRPASEPVLEESGDEDYGREEQGDEGYESNEQGDEEGVSY